MKLKQKFVNVKKIRITQTNGARYEVEN